MHYKGRRWAVTAAAGALVLGLAGCSGSSSEEAADGSVSTVIPVADRKSPIEMSGTTVEGEQLNIATLRGKPLVMNVWGSWCGPCRTEAPALEEAYQELKATTSFVGIAFRDTRTGAKTHEKEYGITYPSLFDEGDLLLNLNGAVTSQSIPVTLILDSEGRIAGRYVGPVSKVTLMDMVEDVQAGSTSTPASTSASTPAGTQADPA